MGRRIVPRDEYPWWVQLSTWGVPGRAGLWAFVGVSFGTALACVAYAIWSGQGIFFLGSLMAVAALPYYFKHPLGRCERVVGLTR
jgi:hypothetical protein